jgi:hypothetical protein
MSCQGDTMKKGISLKLAVMTTVPLKVVVVVASIIPNNMIRARIKGSPLKMCYCPWFKNFIERLESSEVPAWIGPNGGHQGRRCWIISTATGGVVLPLQKK